MKVFFFALFLGWFNASSIVAQISCDLRINGKAPSTISRSGTNFITLSGTGCDEFELQALSGIELIEVEDVYEITQIYDYSKTATIQVIGFTGKSKAVLFNMSIKIVE